MTRPDRVLALVAECPRTVTELQKEMGEPEERIRRWLREWHRAGCVRDLEVRQATATKLWLATHKGLEFAAKLAADEE